MVCCFLMRTELTNALLGWASTWHEIVSTAEATSALDAETDQTLQKAGRRYKWIEDGGNCSETSSSNVLCVCLCINPFDTASLRGQVIRSDFNCTIITIAHRIQTLFPSQSKSSELAVYFLMPWPLGWTMTKSQSLKVEKWWSLIRPRTECELFVFVSGFHFAVFH